MTRNGVFLSRVLLGLILRPFESHIKINDTGYSHIVVNILGNCFNHMVVVSRSGDTEISGDLNMVEDIRVNYDDQLRSNFNSID